MNVIAEFETTHVDGSVECAIQDVERAVSAEFNRGLSNEYNVFILAPGGIGVGEYRLQAWRSHGNIRSDGTVTIRAA